MAKLTLGNISTGGEPAKAKMRMFRYGLRHLTSYEYDTLDLTKLGGHEESKHIKVEEIERFFDRAQKGKPGANYSDPRMTTGAVTFILLETDVTEKGDFTQKYFRKDAAEPMIDKIEGGYRTWGAQTPEQESVGLQFSLRQMDATSLAYMDNALFRTSNILWEFSPDGGRGRWFQLYDMPNRESTRITLPEPTNQIRLRAVSNNPEEWVQALAVSPKLDWQNLWIDNLAWTDGDIELDDFGYLSWPEATGGRGDVIYILYIRYLLYHDVTYTIIVQEPHEVTKLVPITVTTYVNYVSQSANVKFLDKLVFDEEYKVIGNKEYTYRLNSGVNAGKYIAVKLNGVTGFDDISVTTWDTSHSWTITSVHGEVAAIDGYIYYDWHDVADYVWVDIEFNTPEELDEYLAGENKIEAYYVSATPPIVKQRAETHTEYEWQTVTEMVDVEKEVTERVHEEFSEEVTRTKRNDLADWEWDYPEGAELVELVVAAYDVYNDPIYKTLQLEQD